jgi:hypothetical protein
MKIKWLLVSTSTSKHSYNISIQSIRFLRVLTMRNFCSLRRLLCQVLLPRIYQYYQRKQLAQESVLRRKEEQGSSQSMIRVHAIQISYCMFVLKKKDCVVLFSIFYERDKRQKNKKTCTLYTIFLLALHKRRNSITKKTKASRNIV